MGFSASAPRAPMPLAPGPEAPEAPEARLWNAARAAAGRGVEGSPLAAAAAPSAASAASASASGSDSGSDSGTDRSAGRFCVSSSAPASRAAAAAFAAASASRPSGGAAGSPALNKVTSHLGASPRTRAGACHASGHDAALAPFQNTTARPARGVTIIPGAPSPAKTTPGGAPGGAADFFADAPRFFRASNLSAQSATAAASRSSSAPAQATCTPRAPSEASASATGSDGRASADAPGASASSASSAPSFRRLFVRTETDAREPTHGKNVSPPASGAPTSLRYTKTVHVRRSSRLWSWCTLIRSAPSSSAFLSSAFRSVSGASKNPSESTLAASSSSSSRAASGSSPRGARRAVRASITQSPSSFAGTPVKIAALRARSRAAGICKPAASAER